MSQGPHSAKRDGDAGPKSGPHAAAGQGAGVTVACLGGTAPQVSRTPGALHRSGEEEKNGAMLCGATWSNRAQQWRVAANGRHYRIRPGESPLGKGARRQPRGSGERNVGPQVRTADLGV